VLLYVLFVCKCVLYYCHRVSTQLQLNNISILSIDYETILEAVSGVVDVSDAVRGNASCKGDYCTDISRSDRLVYYCKQTENIKHIQ